MVGVKKAFVSLERPITCIADDDFKIMAGDGDFKIMRYCGFVVQ